MNRIFQFAFSKLRGVKVYALVGRSGTGKSYHSKLVAAKHHIDLIIDDGLLIRGDRMTKGFQRPYNARVRTKLLGVLATCMIKAGGEYYKVYKDAKTRYENSREPIGGRTDGLTWHDTSPSHRDKAAKRKMIRRFLEDGYPIWRELWGLPARCPYAEEYLGIRHNDPKWSGKEA